MGIEWFVIVYGIRTSVTVTTNQQMIVAGFFIRKSFDILCMAEEPNGRLLHFLQRCVEILLNDGNFVSSAHAGLMLLLITNGGNFRWRESDNNNGRRNIIAIIALTNVTTKSSLWKIYVWQKKKTMLIITSMLYSNHRFVPTSPESKKKEE